VKEADDFAPGLPAPLPEGETVRWQGRPDWKTLALGAYRLREVGLYFAMLALWRSGAALYAGGGLKDVLRDIAWLLPMAAAAFAILSLLAFLSARATLYTVTERRVVLRIGAALPLTLNLPFSAISNVALGRHGNGHGDIPLTLCKPGGLGYFVLWPHARPWRFSRPEPTLRAVPEPERVCALLADGLRQVHAEEAQARAQSAEPIIAAGQTRPVRVATADGKRRGRRSGEPALVS